MPQWIFRVLRAIGWAALALFCLFLIALGVNVRDERLSTETQTLLRPPQNPYPPEQNIYVALAGFDAPSAKSPIEVGEAKIALYNDRVDAMLSDPFAEDPSSEDPSALKFVGKVDFSLPREPSFWAQVREHRSKIDELAQENRELYERYLALHAMPGYFETERASTAVNVFAPPTEVRNLFLAGFALDIQTGNESRRRAALTNFRRDIDLWHRVLGGEGNLISKMLAVAYLQNDYLVLSDMIADPNTALPDDFDSLLPESALREWNVGKVFASEFRFHSFMYRQTQALGASGWEPPGNSDFRVLPWFNHVFLNPISGYFFKLNATENLDAERMNQIASFATVDPASFAAQRALYEQWESASTRLAKLQTIYNPVGKVLITIAVPAYKQYSLRPYDAAALERLVRLSAAIRRQRIAPSAIPEFMKLHPELSTHPADGGPFSWNAATGEIAVHPVAEQAPERRFWVQIWRDPGL